MFICHFDLCNYFDAQFNFLVILVPTYHIVFLFLLGCCSLSVLKNGVKKQR
jgi:hypothetical protein